MTGHVDTETPGETRVTEADRRVGQKVKEFRLQRGFSQAQLADMIGVTYQQAHKYERGTNRISVGMLVKIATALDVHPRQFFEAADEPTLNEQPRLKLELIRVFDALSPTQRIALMGMARALLPKVAQAA